MYISEMTKENVSKGAIVEDVFGWGAKLLTRAIGP
jgi:hypothetical protein